MTTDTMRVVGGSFPQFSCYWGAPATAKCGVGFLVRKSSVWTASPLTWSINSPCHRHHQTGRLHAISLHIGNGHRELLLYVIYGISGSRWNAHLRRQTHGIIESALADAASRGLPAMIGGDFNLTEADSDLLQRLPLLGWTSLSAHVGMQDIPTCFKNGSSHLDFEYVNNLVLPLFDTYCHGSRAGLADHVPLLFQTGWGISAQHVLRSRDYGDIPLDHGNVLISRRHAVLSSSFSVALQGGDVDYALRLWNVYAESFLLDICFQLHGFQFSFETWPRLCSFGQL